MVLKNLWRRRTRTLLTVAGITIGIAVVVALLLLANGLVNQMTNLVSSGGAEITLMQAGIADTSFSALDNQVGLAVAGMRDVQWVSGLLFQITQVGEKRFFVSMGLDPDAEALRHFRVLEGRMLQAEGEMMLGRMAAGFFGKGVDDTLTVQSRTLRIVGLYETGVSFENAGGVMTLAEAQELFKKPDQVTLFQVKVRPQALHKLDALIEEIESRFPEVQAYRASETAQNMPDIQAFQALAGAMSFIGLLAGALGTMNTMLMSVFERTREIGTLRALGWRKRRVVGMILGESLALGLIGGLIGVGLGVGLALLVGAVPALSGYFVPQLDLAGITTALGVALTLGALGGLYPAWRAARLQPVEALRYE
jgi:ABC-type antimicrobial peptide transport system permease subunit